MEKSLFFLFKLKIITNCQKWFLFVSNKSENYMKNL